MGQKRKKSKAAPASVPESAGVKTAEAGAVKKSEKAGKAAVDSVHIFTPVSGCSYPCCLAADHLLS